MFQDKDSALNSMLTIKSTLSTYATTLPHFRSLLLLATSYSLALPKPIQLSEHRNKILQTGLSGASKVQRLLQKATSQPFLTQTTAPLSVISLTTVATLIVSSDTKTLHSNSSASIDKEFPSIGSDIYQIIFLCFSGCIYLELVYCFESQISVNRISASLI